MTALLPTLGHKELIEFSSNIPNNETYVLISGRTFEPIQLNSRVKDFQKHFKNNLSIHIKGNINNLAPQNPEDHEDFWNWWKQEINKSFPEVGIWDYVIASEKYGLNVAEILDAEFLPYDIERIVNPIKSTNIRQDFIKNWNSILPETKKKLVYKATMFGQESVGKTTLSKLITKYFNLPFIPEYARPYLEAVGEEVTLEKMGNITKGQYSLQKLIENKAENHLIIQDTDLFSTVGYYKIMCEENSFECERLAIETKSNVYYLLPDDVPFEEDILRYGGNVRESSTKFWKNILEKYNLNYVEVPRGLTLEEKESFIIKDLEAKVENFWNNIKSFERE